MGHVDGGEGGPPVHCGQPSGIAVGEDPQGLFLALLGVGFPKELQASFSDPPANLDVFIADFGGSAPGCRSPFARDEWKEALAKVIQSPAQVDGRGARPEEAVIGGRDAVIAGIYVHREREAIGRSSSDQRRATNNHGFDSACGRFQVFKAKYLERMWQAPLVDHFHGATISGRPDRAIMPSINLHCLKLRLKRPTCLKPPWRLADREVHATRQIAS